MKKRNIYTITTLALLIGILGFSFGYLKDINQSSGNNKITLSNFGVQFQSGKEVTEVTMNTVVPMTDSEGVNNPSTTFGIENIQTGIKAKYKVSLVDGATPSTMLNKDAKYQLTKTVNNGTPTTEIYSLRDDGVIDEGIINPGDKIDYVLIMWINYDSNPNGQTFSKHVMVEGMQIPSLDTSGANFPELADNMIPVYYQATSDTEGVWKKADPTNGLDLTTNLPVTTQNYPYQWFDYDNQMWANAVTVKESGTNTREYYLNADIGTTIPMEDITTMWVWIPRYKYIIFNGNNGTAEEQMINVIFEHGKETTGTVRCADDILTDDDSDHSEICWDTTLSNKTTKSDSEPAVITNYKSTYTHPAFCFGTKNNDGTCNGEELTGFWMAKFEMSTDDETCNTTPSDENCNKTGLNILVKPDVYSLRYENVSNMFANMRRMESYGNIHGFKQSETATTWLDTSSNLTGEIANDDNNIDTHMIKNMEWGAVAYLSQSKYGKQGNSLYIDAYKEVYINNNSDYKTGYSGSSYNSDPSNSATYLYNNLTTNGTGQGYKGAGASTTGNVYGIYDMSGGAFDYSMANKINRYGGHNISSAGDVWTSSNFAYMQYYDYYSNNNISTDNYSIAKLGDTIKETLLWYDDDKIIFNNYNSFSVHGKYYNSTTLAGVFSSTAYNGNSQYTNDVSYYSSRPVLTVSRNMSWQ